MTEDDIEHAPSLHSAKVPAVDLFDPANKPVRWVPYWVTQSSAIQPYPVPVMLPPGADTPPEEPHTHLRSFHEVRNYRIEATDGHIGHVESFLIDLATWKIPLVVVDTHRWWPGRHVPLPTEYIENISWHDSSVAVGLSREAVKQGPEFDADTAGLEFLEQLRTHYEKTRSHV